MIPVVLIDDEKNNLETLQRLLEKHCPEVTVSGTAINATLGKELILSNKPAIVFLDIQMPGKSGFDLLQSIPDRNFEVIFVTAFDQYGIQAVKFSAIDYLLKPVDIEELKAAVEKVKKRMQNREQNLQVENLLQFLQKGQHKNEHRLALATSKETRFVKPAQITRCESSNAYTFFFLEGGEKIIVSRPIYEYEELLTDYGFVRCHQSHLVNTKHIKSLIKEDGGHLLMEDGITIPISRNKKESTLAAISFLKT